MAAKVPKFGAWEGGENYTVFFDNARKMKNGAMINPNDPEENPQLFQQNGPGQQSKVPQFGAWDNGDNVGYTVYFENARKTKNGEPEKTDNKPHPSRDPHPVQTRPATIKPEPQEPRSKVPQFGAWEGGKEVAYTACFDNVRKIKNGPTTGPEEPSNGPPQNEPPTHEARSKVPQFGAWDGGENVAYTAYFDNARKNKPEPPVEPQLNRDVGERARPKQRSNKEEGQLRNASRGSTSSSIAGSETHLRQGRQTPGGLSPLHPRGGKPQAKSGGRGSQTPERGATIPPFGVWNKDPAQAEGFTGTFMRAKEDRMTPLNMNTPASYHHQSQHSNQEAKKGCCFPWF